jgi:four helix bundle protein
VGFKDLIVYQKAFGLAMDIFEISKKFPSEEKYALTSQIRRASRSVCANIGEGYRKRYYLKYFVSKCIDSDGENSELQVWTEFAEACNYIEESTKIDWIQRTEEIGKLLNDMIRNPGKYR